MFELERFSRLAKAHWVENWKAYAWFLGIGVMLHFVVALMILATEFGFFALQESGQGALYYAGLFLLGPIFAGRYFQKMSSRQSALLQLMRPASTFEKWLLALIIVALLYPLAYTAAFYICDLPAAAIARSQAAAHLAELAARKASSVSGFDSDAEALGYGLDLTKYSVFLVKPTGMRWIEMLLPLLLLLAAQGFAVFGSLHFQRAPFIKTLLAGFLILLLAILLVNVADADPERFLGFWESEDPYSPLLRVAYGTLWLGTPVALWLACYFALKEREIAG